ncbi:MAG: rRNA maturation RNase YbeY [Candidatus Taylorbacteria bacterium RIFCSPHIGHO2_02_FULL_46_13]|uniref:Endoribonuclease YbeY n=1 Tax=Candidatus Taylorbacteria bacterium RIFCSPHIGHO2_02_FULL_46_13 TaxID=1802312 RepID=A0A1G2MSL0_9BACT|nr:MAG: rRNA maturation RNase YbeY [Candidatus Taylorbacteria bacterium RIFCSPHIGHO2_02_FULL_46_13]
MKKDSRFLIVNLTKRNPSATADGLLFKRIKNAILGTRYRLELLFMSPRDSQILNHRYRNKNKPANVLSFVLSQKEGQIVVCPECAVREASRYEQTKKNFIRFLFIHAILHLKGLRHGSTMEAEERRFCKRFLPPKASSAFSYGKKNISRNRYRNLSGQSDGRGKRRTV